MTKPLSPAAQQVMNAFLGDCESTGLQMDDLRENVAAALRAAADVIEPIDITPDHEWLLEQLRAIAAELELDG